MHGRTATLAHSGRGPSSPTLKRLSGVRGSFDLGVTIHCRCTTVLMHVEMCMFTYVMISLSDLQDNFRRVHLPNIPVM